VARLVPGRQVVSNCLVEREQACRVALLVEEPGQGRRQRSSVFGLRVADRAEAHRSAVVHEQVAAKVRLVLELLHVATVRAGEQPPIEIPRVVAGGILAVFGKLDGEAVIGTAMEPRPKALDHHAGAQLQIANGHQGLRGDESFVGGDRHSQRVEGRRRRGKSFDDKAARCRQLSKPLIDGGCANRYKMDSVQVPSWAESNQCSCDR